MAKSGSQKIALIMVLLVAVFGIFLTLARNRAVTGNAIGEFCPLDGGPCTKDPPALLPSSGSNPCFCLVNTKTTAIPNVAGGNFVPAGADYRHLQLHEGKPVDTISCGDLVAVQSCDPKLCTGEGTQMCQAKVFECKQTGKYQGRMILRHTGPGVPNTMCEQ